VSIRGEKMEVHYLNLNCETLCFSHAVKAVIEDDEKITACVDDVSHDPWDSMAGMMGVCHKCFPTVLKRKKMTKEELITRLCKLLDTIVNTDQESFDDGEIKNLIKELNS